MKTIDEIFDEKVTAKKGEWRRLEIQKAAKEAKEAKEVKEEAK